MTKEKKENQPEIKFVFFNSNEFSDILKKNSEIINIKNRGKIILFSIIVNPVLKFYLNLRRDGIQKSRIFRLLVLEVLGRA